MNRFGLIVIALVVLPACAAEADFYRYVDEKGNVRYTDDATLVPEGQKDSALKYPEAGVPVVPAAAGEPSPQGSDTGGGGEEIGGTQPVPQAPAGDEAPAPPPPADPDEWRRQLEREKADLDASYRTLTGEIEAFEAEKAQPGTPAQIRAYNERVTALNRRIESYEERRRNLNRQIEAYNGTATAADKTSQ